MRLRAILVAFLALAALLFGCGEGEKAQKMRDGYYSAEAASFDSYGWKEYITIYVNNSKIVTAEYNAKNESGFIKSWDMQYMRKMNETDGTYPNQYTRGYVDALLALQDPAGVDVITGATQSHVVFQLLAEAAISQAIAGDKSVALVELPEEHAS